MFCFKKCSYVCLSVCNRQTSRLTRTLKLQKAGQNGRSGWPCQCSKSFVSFHRNNKISTQLSFRLVTLCTLPTHNEHNSKQNIWIVPEGKNTEIRIFNSLTREKEDLILPKGNILNWYSCGPTVYDDAHIGHASSYVRMDIIRRILRDYFNIDVVLAMGVTDIDDKIILKAQQLGLDFRRMARNYEHSFFRDLELLGALPPTVKTRVTEHIPHIIQFIHKIMENGYAYSTPSGSVYFDLQKYGRYWKLQTSSNQKEEAGDDEKRSIRDFALWKAAKAGEPFWDSPFGKGRPGWHIECSAMASEVFGQQFDVHSGGEDLKFPHHENEIAQSEACLCCEQWSNYWLHTGHLHLSNQQFKMSKSLKNTIGVRQLLENYSPNQFRMFCMLRPYRHAIEYSDETMHKAVSVMKTFLTFLSTANDYAQGQISSKPLNDTYLFFSLQEAKKKVDRALRDDFDSPRAVLALEELVKRCNIELMQSAKTKADSGARSVPTIAAVSTYVERTLQMFGFKTSNTWKNVSHGKLSSVVDSVLAFRKEIRDFALNQPVSDPEITTAKDKKIYNTKKNLALLQACDNLREDLALSGIKVMDQPSGKSTWEMESSRGSEKK